MTRPARPSRRASREAVRRELLVFVEGERTEEDYLTHWRRAYRQTVSVLIGEFRGTPRQLIDHAVRQKRIDARAANRGRGRAFDEVWCCFDVDEHPNLDEVWVLAQAHGIRLAVSDPCLELWFVIHFQDQTAAIDRHAAQRLSEALLSCRKNLDAEALARLADAYPAARTRAIALNAKHEGDGTPMPANPSSGVWRLIDSIRQPA